MTTEPATRILTGILWGDDSVFARQRSTAAGPSQLEPLIGMRLSYRASTETRRVCLGHSPFRSATVDYVDCDRVPESGGRKCERCAIVDATHASNLHHAHTRDRAEIDPAIAEHLRNPNLLYLAAFRDGSIKVGTSTEKRGDKRLREQGAWRALIVARADDGYLVRELEDQVTEDLGIGQSVSIGRKLDGMASPVDDARLERELDRWSGGVHDLLQRMRHSRIGPQREPWAFPVIEATNFDRLHRYPLSLAAGSHDFEIVEACGRMIIVRRPGQADLFVADIGELFGLELELGEFGSDELIVQDSLF